jgi:hypothetical protein
MAQTGFFWLQFAEVGKKRNLLMSSSAKVTIANFRPAGDCSLRAGYLKLPTALA